VLTIVADVANEFAEAVGQRFSCQTTSDWREAVTQDNVDAVIVLIPTHLSSEVNVLAAQSGKYVLTEMLCATSSAEFTVVQAAQATDVLLKAGYNHRYHPAVRRAHDLFEQGTDRSTYFCPLRLWPWWPRGIRIRMAFPRVPFGRRRVARSRRARSRFVSMLPRQIRRGYRNVSTAFWPIVPAEDNVFALLRTPGNVVAQLHASWTNWKNTFSFEVFGEKGLFESEPLKNLTIPSRENGRNSSTLWSKGASPQATAVRLAALWS
jgi:predicted dehydrogenase